MYDHSYDHGCYDDDSCGHILNEDACTTMPATTTNPSRPQQTPNIDDSTTTMTTTTTHTTTHRRHHP